jgi:hypothetical protein
MSFLTLMTLSSPQTRLKALGIPFAQSTTNFTHPRRFRRLWAILWPFRGVFTSLPVLTKQGIIFRAFFSLMFVEKLHTYIFNFYQCLNLPAALLSSSRPAQRGSFRNRRPGRTSLLVGRLCLKKRRKLIHTLLKKQNLYHYFNRDNSYV